MIGSLIRIRSPFNIDKNHPSLILYFPFWCQRGDMTGGVIYSYDKNHQSGTVSEAVWGTKGRYFDGVDDNITIPDSLLYDFTNFTILGWANPTSDTTAYAAIISNQELLAGGGFFVDRNNQSTTQYRFGWGYTADWATGTNFITMTNGAWQQFGGVKSGDTLELYLNGEQTSTETVASANFTGSDEDVKIGASPIASRNWKGYIGEILIYNTALSAAFIRSYYEKTKWRY